jgi:hypothetical protein
VLAGAAALVAVATSSPLALAATGFVLFSGALFTSGSAAAATEQRTPNDPNDIVGPAGFGPSAFVLPDQPFPYRVDFENKPDASAPAQVVTVTQHLDPNLDLSTFQLGDMGFGNTVIHVPAGRSFYSTRVDMRSTLGLFVDVTASLNLGTGVVTWTFTSIDPATGDVPANPLAGFLPPDVTAPQGEAFVAYAILPRASVSTGTQINAKATVVFDNNAPLDTASIFNTIDAGPPTSSMNPLPGVTTTATFPVSWSGSDDAGGSGIANYDIFVSTDGGPFTIFLQGTTLTSATFVGAFGHTYAFYSVATDNVGNRQAHARWRASFNSNC